MYRVDDKGEGGGAPAPQSPSLALPLANNAVSPKETLSAKST